ncbi:right-handed parallel beta-helix repeat-containing protein [uncultured Treponema sp.]|uniref:pectate lyase family protein n=1 Tax=uncultured Treponema sp. TaxID=162155 RepID=UPI0025DBE266|nr:right-handed parallel beta-helix repeat-containing protein [uncultured Treponema sp.]
MKSLLKKIFMAGVLATFVFASCSTDSDSSSNDISKPAAPENQNQEKEKEQGKEDNNNNPAKGDDNENEAKLDEPSEADVSNASVNIVKGEGWLNSAYVIFEQVDGASYKVLCDDKEIDESLIRYYNEYVYYEQSESESLQVSWTKKTLSKVVRADALGLAAGEHTIKVAAVSGGTTSAYSSATMKVVDHDRSGFAFTSSDTPGAYKADGTLKDGAIVIYVTGDTAKTVSYSSSGKKAATYTGLQDILSETSLKNLSVPLDIRIVGTISKDQMDSLGSSAEGLQIKSTTASGITIEGVGHDAAISGFGFLIREAKYVEVSNLGIYNFMDDGVSIDTNNSYLWIHNNDISYGGKGSDADQAKGDGSLDLKKSTYSTLSYNHFWDSGKCNLLDASEHASGGSNYLSYHHNWYDHSDSRHPRIRNASAVHVYNNYYDGNAKYGVGITTGASALVEGNFFRDANDPMMSSKQGTDATGAGTFSGEDGGIIKAWNNFIGYNTANTVHFVTNKYRYGNNASGEATKTALGGSGTASETIGTETEDGWLLYSWTYGEELPSFISKNDASDKGASDSTKPYYQFANEKTGFTLKVPSNASKVVITAKSASKNVSSATVKVGSVSQSVTDANYPAYTFDVSSDSSTSLAIVAGKEGSINIKSIKVYAPTAWTTTYSTGVALDDIDAYEVDSRSETVPASVVTKAGGTSYSNFDTELGLSGLGLSGVPSNPLQAKADVMKFAGRHEPDFAYTFNNAKDDKDDDVISELKEIVVAYKTSLTKIQGSGTSSGTEEKESGEGKSESDNGNEGESGNGNGNESGTPEPAPVTGAAVVSLVSDGKAVSSDSRVTLTSCKVNGDVKNGALTIQYNGKEYPTLKMESASQITVKAAAGTTITVIGSLPSGSQKCFKVNDKDVKLAAKATAVTTFEQSFTATGNDVISKGDKAAIGVIVIGE